MTGLVEFARANKLGASRVTAIGAFRDVTLGYFDWETKEYKKIPVNEQVEVLSLIGDVALKGRRAEGSRPRRRRPLRRLDARRPPAGGTRPADPRGDPHRVARALAKAVRREERARVDPHLKGSTAMVARTKAAQPVAPTAIGSSETAVFDAVFNGRSSAWTRRHTENGQHRIAPGRRATSRGGRPPPRTVSAPPAARPPAPRAWSGSRSGEASSPRSSIPAWTRRVPAISGLIVTDGHGFFSDECRDAEHRIECPVTGVPLYRLINTCRQGRYRIEKTIFAHPHQDAVLQVTRFEPLKNADFRLIISTRFWPPTWGTKGAETPPGSASTAACRCCSPAGDHHAWPWPARLPGVAGSVGYAGASDGRQDLSRTSG